jgi:hypothetical protein
MKWRQEVLCPSFPGSSGVGHEENGNGQMSHSLVERANLAANILPDKLACDQLGLSVQLGRDFGPPCKEQPNLHPHLTLVTASVLRFDSLQVPCVVDFGTWFLLRRKCLSICSTTQAVQTKGLITI